MANQLSFVATYTVAEFKDLYNVSKIDIIKNPNGGKLFFTANTGIGTTIKGAVSEGYKENPAISKVILDDNSEMFLIHKRGEGSGANIIDSM